MRFRSLTRDASNSSKSENFRPVTNEYLESESLNPFPLALKDADSEGVEVALEGRLGGIDDTLRGVRCLLELGRVRFDPMEGEASLMGWNPWLVCILWDRWDCRRLWERMGVEGELRVLSGKGSVELEMGDSVALVKVQLLRLLQGS